MMDDPNWNVLASFDDPSGLKNSDIQKDIDEIMYLRNRRDLGTKEFACKYILGGLEHLFFLKVFENTYNYFHFFYPWLSMEPLCRVRLG